MRNLFTFYVFIQCLGDINSGGIRDKVRSYFEGESFASFQKYWQGHRKSFENAVLLALKDSYGQRDMNVYIRRSTEDSKLADGLHFSDNIVDILLDNLQLVKMPQLTSPEVTFALASNILRIESSLSKMIVETQYTLFRNDSTMTTGNNQDPYKSSPFTFQQVKNLGLLAIVAEGCTLVGYTIAKLSGQSVNLGYDTFRVTDCEFHIEISTYQAKSPPVIAPYFDTKQRDILEQLITRMLQQEVIPILQASMFSYVNTSVIFGSNLQKYLKPQSKIFKDTSKYIKHKVREANKETVSRNEAAIELPPIEISWNSTSLPAAVWNFIKISNTTVYGIDSLYSAHNGGPYKLQSIKIAETLRFNALMVRGNFYYENNTAKADHDYVVEIRDVHVNFEQDLDAKRPLSLVFAGWRTLETSIIELEKHVHERKAAISLISGYLINVIPEVLKNHLLNIFAKNDLDENTSDDQNIKPESKHNNERGDDNLKERSRSIDSEKNLLKAVVLLSMASAHKKNKQEEKLGDSQVSNEKDKSETREEPEEESVEALVNRSEVKNGDTKEVLQEKSSNEGDKAKSLSERSEEVLRQKTLDKKIGNKENKQSNLKSSYKGNADIKNTINEIQK